MKRDLKKRWVAALRSGEYPQTQGYLHRIVDDGDNGRAGYCCLGVLCALENVKAEPSYTGKVERFEFPSGIKGALLPPDEEFGLSWTQIRTLSNMNDGRNGKTPKNFTVIAAWIVKNIPSED